MSKTKSSKLGGAGPLGKWLRENRIPTDEFVRVSGLPRAAVDRILSGTSKPTLAMALRISWATQTGVPVDAWLDDPVTFEEYRWLTDRGSPSPEMKPLYSEGWMRKIRGMEEPARMNQANDFPGKFSDTPDDGE